MSELGRIKDEDGLAGDLLRAAADDAPPASSRRAIGAAIGLAPTIGHGASAVHAAKASAVAKLGGGIALKVTAVVAVVGTAVGVHHVATRAPASSPPPPALVASRAPAPIVMPAPAPSAIAPPLAPPAPAPTAPPAPVEASPASPAPRAPIARRATVPAPPPPVETAPPPAAEANPAPVAPAPPSLGDEIAQLELALAAVRRHDPSAALAALDAYDRRFPAGKLAPEALAARVEATLAAGDRAGARSLAARFLAEHPKSPLAQHVRDLVEAR